MSQSVERASRLLLWLAKQPVADARGRRLRDIAAGTGLDKATAHRLLQSLVTVGFVQQDPITRDYSLGSAALHLAGAAREAHPFLRKCVPVVDRLAAELDETVSLGERRGVENVTIYEVESQQAVRYANKPGRASPLHVAAGGRALLAWSSADVIEEVLANPLERYTDRTITDPAVLAKVVETTQQAGYCHSYGERHHGVHSLAVPILGPGGYAVGAASIIWPSRGTEVDEDRLRTWPALLVEAFADVGGLAQGAA